VENWFQIFPLTLSEWTEQITAVYERVLYVLKRETRKDKWNLIPFQN